MRACVHAPSARAPAWFGRTRSVRRRDVAIDPREKGGFARQTHLAHHLFAVAEHGESGDALDPMSGPGARVLLRVELQNEELAGVLPSDFFEHRSRHATRPAPRRPEIYQDGHRRGLKRAFELGFVHRLRGARRIDCLLAAPTDRTAPDPALWNPIERGTVRAAKRQHPGKVHTDFALVNTSRSPPALASRATFGVCRRRVNEEDSHG